MQAQRPLVFLISTLTCMGLLLLSGCKKSQKANEETLTKLCMDTAQSSYSSSTLAHMEQKFFTDKKARGILKLSDLLLGSYREVESSATLGVYELLFYMVDSKDDVVLLHNGPNTGGISLENPNHVSYQGVCEVKWSHFKGSPLIKKFKLQALSPDQIAQKIQKSKLKDRAKMP